VTAMASVTHAVDNPAASVASGSFLTDGMIIAPCTVKTLSGIANSFTDNLMIRAADVCLKEKRKLLLMVRETPLHEGHLQLMTRASRMGAQIMPPVPAFYHRPSSLDDIVNQTVGKALDYFGIDHSLFERWH
ncbi:MAG: UbiX family flavin prenyltransferase, partial [Desulfobacteraceae bacterium]